MASDEHVSAFLIYGLIDPRTGRCHYVGASARGLARSAAHAQECHIRQDERRRDGSKAAWLRSLPKRPGSLPYDVRVLQRYGSSDEVYDAENDWIIRLRAAGEPLTNVGTGGRSPTLGRKHTPEARAKMSVAKFGRTGRKQSAEERQKRSRSLKGRPKSATARANMSAAKKDRPSSFRGRRHSEEAKERLRQAQRGRSASAETRAKMSATRKGRTVSEDVRAKLSAAAIARWQRWKTEVGKDADAK